MHWALIAATLMCVLAGCATSVPIQKVADVVPPTISEGTSVRPLTIERIVSQVPRGEQIGTIRAGLLCLPYASIIAGSGQFEITDSRYLDAVYHEFAATNYPVTNSAGDLFRTAASNATQLRLAGRITSNHTNICFPMGGIGDFSNGKAQASISIEWQVFDEASKSIVFKEAMDGFGEISSSTMSPAAMAQNLAVGMATRRLLASQGFQSLSYEKSLRASR